MIIIVSEVFYLVEVCAYVCLYVDWRYHKTSMFGRGKFGKFSESAMTCQTNSFYYIPKVHSCKLFILHTQMYFKFHTTYEDEHGVVVKDLSHIVPRYLKSKSGFVVDLIALIPFEVLSFTIQDKFYQERVYLILQLIHLVRMFRIVLILSPEYWKIPRWYVCYCMAGIF